MPTTPTTPDLKALATQLRTAADQCEHQAAIVRAGTEATGLMPPWLSILITVLKTVLDAVPTV